MQQQLISLSSRWICLLDFRLAENGQGLRTTFSIIAAEVLGIHIDDIYYLEQDTGLVPDSGPTVASRSTLMGGGAVKVAAEMVRTRLEEYYSSTGIFPKMIL